MNNLFKGLEEELHSIGYEKEKRSYTPNITLGREVLLKEDFNSIKNLVNLSEKIDINKVTLMESTRVKGKLCYIPIFTVSLKKY